MIDVMVLCIVDRHVIGLKFLGLSVFSWFAMRIVKPVVSQSGI
jgi:hypothetical protein